MTDDRWVAIILAAGKGTRMRSSLPKVAHPIAGRPVVRHVIEAARAAGVDDCIVVVGADEDANAVRDAAGPDVRFAVQQQPLGTGDAVEAAREAAGDAAHVLIMNGDVPLVLPETIRRLMTSVVRAGTPVAAGVARGDDGAHDATVLALLTAEVPLEAYGYLRLDGDRITDIIETRSSDGVDRAQPHYINSGQYAARASWLWAHLPRIQPADNGERYLTQLAAMAHEEGTPARAVQAERAEEVRGINDRVQLAEAEASVRDRIRRAHMLAGVTIADPPSTFIDADVTIGADTVIEPQTHLRGATSVGAGCRIGPGSDVRDSVVGDRCTVRYSTIEESTLEADVEMGPYSHLRAGSYISQGVHIGNFAEVKASRLGRDTKIGHFSYIGDAQVGDGVNIGAGTITANYDGTSKHPTVIGDGAFIGSDTVLVAPVAVGRGARTGAGSVVTRDVPDGMTALGAPARLRGHAGSGDSGEEERDTGD